MALVFTHKPYCTGPPWDGGSEWSPRARSSSPPQPSFTTRQRELGARPPDDESMDPPPLDSNTWAEWDDELDDNPVTLPPLHGKRAVAR